jgi:branched-chain amino acid transport system permease protein
VFGGAIGAGQLENLQKVLFGGLIIWFLIREPNGLSAYAGKLAGRLAGRRRRAALPR